MNREEYIKTVSIQKGEREYRFLSDELSQITYVGRKAKQETMREVLHLADEGFLLKPSFSLEALFMEIKEELRQEVEREVVVSFAKANRKSVSSWYRPKWKDYHIAPPPEFDAERIKALRKEIRVSQKMLAAMLGVTTKAVESWEQGGSVPGKSARRMLELLQIDPYLPIKYKFVTKKETT